jgi:hypothetical protein
MKLKHSFATGVSFLVLTVVFVNLRVVSLSIMVFLQDNEYKKTNYHYSSACKDGFSVWSRKGYEDLLEQFAVYKKLHPTDTVLYRNFQPDYRKIWRWYFYWSEQRYKLPYTTMPDDAYQLSRGVKADETGFQNSR